MPFSSIIGHAHLIDLLSQAVAHGRVPQSLLFAGSEGVGKRTVALALAQEINCPNRRGTGACGTCPTCQRIARGQHSDVTLIDRDQESSIKIRVLRERLLDVVGYRPFEVERRIYIIDGADDLTEEAQDALLKTLEEPPPAAILILITAYPDTLRPTVQSRCRRLRFAPLSERDVAAVLIERCRVEPAKAGTLAALSGGSVARALAEQTGSLGEDRDAALSLLVAAAKDRGVRGRLKAAAELAQHRSKRRDREAVSGRLAMAASLLRDLGALRSGATSALANADLADPLARLASDFAVSRVTDAFAAVHLAQEALDKNASPKIVADWVALSI